MQTSRLFTLLPEEYVCTPDGMEIDKDGNLIGLNFDRVWEGTMSDIVFDPDYCRNISLDIRYVLFTIDKLAGADHLLKEMVFTE